ncbi:MAG: Rrf2 family transcriptional regulator [Phycisphaerales bacterium]|nr:MAG: Rrf2 family transcriptional regulator [Phycisphaerales bacterium]
MFSLSQTTGYAILALSLLADRDDRWVLSKEIASVTGIPRPFLSKILHALGKSGLVRAKRGYRGGVALARPAAQISLWDVSVAVEGSDFLPQCMIGLAECSDLICCPTHDFWMKERARIERELRRVSLALVAGHVQKSGAKIPLVHRPGDTAADSAGEAEDGQTGGGECANGCQQSGEGEHCATEAQKYNPAQSRHGPGRGMLGAIVAWISAMPTGETSTAAATG